MFLSDGRCVFEEDAPRYEEQGRKREELIASKELPVVGNCEVLDKRNCDNCGLFVKWEIGTLRPCFEKTRIDTPKNHSGATAWRLKNLGMRDGRYAYVKPGANNCPGWKEKEEK